MHSRLIASLILFPVALAAQEPGHFTHADSLRGGNGPARSWWNATFYDLHVKVNPADSSIVGWNGITYRVLKPASVMQVDLQLPLEVDSIVQDGRKLGSRRDGNAFFVSLTSPQKTGSRRIISVYYHGKPRVAKRAPWDGGFVWQRDSLHHLWIATANEGLGASVWWPNKDLPAEEPDSQRIAITLPDSITDVSNGRLRSSRHNPDGTTTYEWFVSNPINNYDVTVQAGDYAHFSDVYGGEGGDLTLDFWPLAYHADTARKQFEQAVPMLICFEHWFGPYPWYKDGYKLVEVPHLGMEHQSAVAYGNRFKNGYMGRDLSETGLGLEWDFIIVHESAHEWWGNNISARDHADMWIHESFANYAEALYTECRDGKRAGAKYVIGVRRLIRNDAPVQGVFGVNKEGSGDMYYKGGNMLHTIRQVVNDDAKWRDALRGAQKTFWHQTISGAMLEGYLSRSTGVDLSKIFEQYLTTTKIPVLEHQIEKGTLSYRWANVVPGFDMPVRVTLADTGYAEIRPTTEWKSTPITLSDPGKFRVDDNYYVEEKAVRR